MYCQSYKKNKTTSIEWHDTVLTPQLTDPRRHTVEAAD